MKNSLSSKGLSMSQAQSISNLCNQRAKEISTKLDNINNVSKELTIGTETYIETQGNPIPENVVELLTSKARYSATQAFLMENIKAKDELINEIKREHFIYDVEAPVRPQTISEILPNEVDADFGLNQMTAAEYNEYLEAEAYASHIGQFIHKKGTLDRLRAELPTIKTLEFMEIEVGKKTPLKVSIHHTPEQLTVTELTLPLIPNQTSYTLGPSSSYDINTDKPLRLIQSFLRNMSVSPPIDLPMSILSQQEYNILGSKRSTGTVNSVYYWPYTTYGELKVFLTPDSNTATNYDLHITVQRPIEDITTANQTFDFPSEWYQSLRWGLASEIAADYGLPLDKLGGVIARAESYKQRLMAWDTEYASTFFQPDIRAQILRFR